MRNDAFFHYPSSTDSIISSLEFWCNLLRLFLPIYYFFPFIRHCFLIKPSFCSMCKKELYFRHDNASAPKGATVFEKNKWLSLHKHPPYSPDLASHDLAPCDLTPILNRKLFCRSPLQEQIWTGSAILQELTAILKDEHVEAFKKWIWRF
jgi:hypothetical protein